MDQKCSATKLLNMSRLLCVFTPLEPKFKAFSPAE